MISGWVGGTDLVQELLCRSVCLKTQNFMAMKDGETSLNTAVLNRNKFGTDESFEPLRENP